MDVKARHTTSLIALHFLIYVI